MCYSTGGFSAVFYPLLIFPIGSNTGDRVVIHPLGRALLAGSGWLASLLYGYSSGGGGGGGGGGAFLPAATCDRCPRTFISTSV